MTNPSSASIPKAESTWLSKSASQTRGSDKTEVQFHYDISNDFFKLWQDPSQTYSCAYFEKDDYTLEQAQLAKVDLSLGKLGLEPGMTLLDIGCGWGSTIQRAVEKYDVNVIGLTLSENQKQHIEQNRFPNIDTTRNMEVRLQPWEEFDEPVDRVVSIGAFEHFGFNKYDDYFKKTFNLMPDDGVMMLHTIIIPSDEEIKARKLPLTMSRVRFIKFIMDEIYPGGRLPLGAQVEEHAVGLVGPLLEGLPQGAEAVHEHAGRDVLEHLRDQQGVPGVVFDEHQRALVHRPLLGPPGTVQPHRRGRSSH